MFKVGDSVIWKGNGWCVRTTGGKNSFTGENEFIDRAGETMRVYSLNENDSQPIRLMDGKGSLVFCDKSEIEKNRGKYF